jgi:hypothetical protein
MATDLTLLVEDRPGALADVGEALGKAGINMEGGCGTGADGRGVIHVCVQDGAAARTALQGAGITVHEENDAILGEPFKGADEPGAMGKMARAIAEAGVNVRVMYLATGNRGVLVTDNNAKVRELMAAMM